MSTPIDICQRFKAKIADLTRQIESIRRHPAGLGGQLTQDQRERIEQLVDAIDQEKVLMEDEGCFVEPGGTPIPAPWIKNLVIAGFEITQATQYSNITHQGSNPQYVTSQGSTCPPPGISGQPPDPPPGISGQPPDNSVPLVTHKNTILRVYIHTRYLRGSVPTRVTGVLQYSRLGDHLFTFPDLSPINGPLQVNVDIPLDDKDFQNTDRGNSNHTLNFAIPAQHCSGNMEFTVRIFDPDHMSEIANNSEPLRQVYAFRDIGQLRLWVMLYDYDIVDTTGNLVKRIPHPTPEQLRSILSRFTEKVFPIEGFNFTGIQNMVAFGEGPGKVNVMNELKKLLEIGRLGNDIRSPGPDIVIGLIPSVGRAPGGARGAGGNTWHKGSDGYNISYGAAAVVFDDDDDGTATAQALGYALRGSGNTPCPNTDPPNPNVCYPWYGTQYETQPRGSIGEFGFDPAKEVVIDPTRPLPIYDYMSHCGPKWVSPYTYIETINRIFPVWVQRSNPPSLTSQISEILLINFQINEDGRKIHLNYGYHIPVPNFPMNQYGRAEFHCKLLDEKQVTLQSGACYVLDHRDIDNSQTLFGFAPWNPEAKSLALFQNGECIYTFKIQDDEPRVSMPKVELDEGKGLARIEWSEESKGKESPHYILRYSNDQGRSWLPVAIELKETNFTINTDQLPGGDSCIFQIIAYSGLRTTRNDSSEFHVIKKPRQAYILFPEPDAIFLEGDTIILRGGGYSPDFGSTRFEEVVWHSRIDGFLGMGHEIILHSLSIGLHRIMVTVPDGFGNESTVGLYISVKQKSI